MSHPFGDLLSHYRAHKHGLSQTRLAHLAGYDPAVLVRMCQGKKDLTGPSGRDRILRIIDVLHGEGVLKTQVEANALLEAAGLPPLYAGQLVEAALLKKLDGRAPVLTASPAVHKSHMPHPLTSLVGRETDVAQVKQWLLRPEVRVLSLIGPPGVGKTRLALQVAAEIEASGTTGEVFFVPLAPVGEAGFVLPAIAQALGVIQSHTLPLIESIKLAIQGRRMLLVIDNFEHVPEAAPQVAELLAASPLLKVLTTSRVALRISGEHEYAVQPLALQPATDLLIQRALAVKPSLSLDDKNTPVMHAICNRLDRLPLAIELAAARLKLFTPEALLGRLEKMPLDVLTHGASDLPARQQRLRSTIDWSYGLLNTNEQAVFCKLGVFAGGFTLASAEAVAGADWETLSSLLDKSLIVAAGDVNGESRFTMLELLREYAVEKLEVCGEGEFTRQRHAEFVITLAESAEPNMLTGEQVRWSRRLNNELSNMRAALRWAQDHNEYEVTMRIMGETWRYWQTRTLPPEGLAWIMPALKDDPAISAVVRAKAWHAAGALAMFTANFDLAKQLHEYSLMLAEQTEDNYAINLALAGATASNITTNNFEIARALNERALLNTAGEISFHRAIALIFQVPFFDRQQDYQGGIVVGSQARDMLHTLGDQVWEMFALQLLCHLFISLKNMSQCLLYLRDLFNIARQLGSECVEASPVCTSFYFLGKCASGYGRANDTVRLCAAAESGMSMLGQVMPEVDSAAVKKTFEALSDQAFDEKLFSEAWAEGHAMTLNQAIDYALEVANELIALEAEREAEIKKPPQYV